MVARSTRICRGQRCSWQAGSRCRAASRPSPSSPAAAVPDPRHISNGWNIPSEGYADQPYIVKTDDGAWLCVMTTGAGVEGAGGQHVVSMRSTDQGRTWEKIVPIEPADGPGGQLRGAAQGARRPHLRLLQPQHRPRAAK